MFDPSSKVWSRMTLVTLAETDKDNSNNKKGTIHQINFNLVLTLGPRMGPVVTTHPSMKQKGVGRGSRVRGSRFEVRGSRFEVRGSRFEVRGSRFEVRGSRFEVRGSRFEVRGSRVEGRRSKVERRASRVEGRG